MKKPHNLGKAGGITSNLSESLQRNKKTPRSVVTLGWVSFFTDMASEMIYPLIPLFLVQTLGASPALLGIIDGVAEGVGSGLRWFAGAWSDRIGKRKPFVLAGYSISAVSKPIMGAAAVFGWPLFMAGRCSDRVGKSLRTGARDALIADNTTVEQRGAAFGLHRAMDTAGAVCGPLLGWAILYILPTINLGWIFVIAIVPGLASVAVVAAAVREKSAARSHGNSPRIFQKFPSAFWVLLVIMGVFALANSSDTFLLLRSHELGLSTRQVILAFTLHNVVYALCAMPAGSLSDRVGRHPVIAAGWFVYAAVYVGFALAAREWLAWVLLAGYGAYQSMAEGVGKALISDVVPSQQRAGAIGLIYTVAGFGQLVGSIAVGATWRLMVPGTSLRMPFAIDAALATAAGLLLLFCGGTQRQRERQLS